MANKLTVSKINSLKPKPSTKSIKDGNPKLMDYREGDGNGLYIKVDTKGNKSWQFRYKGSFHGIGAYPALGLTGARKVATEFNEVIADGGNPIVHRDSKKDTDELLVQI